MSTFRFWCWKVKSVDWFSCCQKRAWFAWWELSFSITQTAAVSIIICILSCHHTALNPIGHSFFLMNSPHRWKAPTSTVHVVSLGTSLPTFAKFVVKWEELGKRFHLLERYRLYEHSKFLLCGPFGLITVYNECWRDVSTIHAFAILWNQLPTSCVNFFGSLQGE